MSTSIIKGRDVVSIEVGEQLLPIERCYKEIGTVFIFCDSKAHMASGEIVPIILVSYGASWYVAHADSEINICDLVMYGESTISPDKVPTQFTTIIDDEPERESESKKDEDITSCFAITGFALVTAFIGYGFLFATQIMLS